MGTRAVDRAARGAVLVLVAVGGLLMVQPGSTLDSAALHVGSMLIAALGWEPVLYRVFVQRARWSRRPGGVLFGVATSLGSFVAACVVLQLSGHQAHATAAALLLASGFLMIATGAHIDRLADDADPVLVDATGPDSGRVASWGRLKRLRGTLRTP